MILNSKSIYYDDANLIAQPQYKVLSRGKIPKELSRIMVSPMASVVGEKFALKAYELGLTICLSRFHPDQLSILKKVKNRFGSTNRCIASVGIGTSEWLRASELIKEGFDHILVDVANGYLSSVVEFANNLLELTPNVIVGNVHSFKGFNLYDEVGVRVGIGSGTACKTSNVTGYNRGQITEIMECYQYGNKSNYIIADGGIKNSGHAAKAFAVGAAYAMMGSYFSLAEEAQNVIDGEYKYWGGASHLQQKKQFGKIYRHSEGKELELDKNNIKPLEVLVNDLWGGLASAVSYSGHKSLSDFIGQGVLELKL